MAQDVVPASQNNKEVPSLSIDQITDSTSSHFSEKKQTLLLKEDSLRQRINAPTDFLTTKISCLKSSLQHRIDSLKAKGQPTEKMQARLNKLDSLSKSPAEAQQKLTALQSELQDSIYNSIPGAKETMAIQSKANGAFGKVNEVTTEIGIGQVGGEYQNELGNAVPGVPDLNTPKIDGIPGLDINKDLGVNTSIPTDVNGLNKNPNLKIPDANLGKVNELLPDEIQDATKAVEGVTEKFQEGQQILGEGQEHLDQVKSIQEEGLRSEKINDLAENQLSKVDEISALEKERAATIGQMEEYKKLIEQYKNEKAIKAELEEKSKELANDIVAANQSKVDGSLKKLRKYNRKFDNIPDIRELPKRPPNVMKKLGLRHRVVPGFAFYTFATDRVWLQFDPQVFYKFNGNFSAGAGTIFRFSMKPSNVTFDNLNNTFGFKVFAQHHVYKTMWLRAEIQNLSWKPLHLLHNDPNYMDNVTVGAIGIMKNVNIAKRVKANAQTLYHYTIAGSDPYKTKIIFRLGIDFSLKKREKVEWKVKWKAARKVNRSSKSGR